MVGVGLGLVALGGRSDDLSVRGLQAPAVLVLRVLVGLERELVGVGLDPLDAVLRVGLGLIAPSSRASWRSDG
jgi:hypothetical protein